MPPRSSVAHRGSLGAASSSTCPRVRADPNRRIGNTNAVANGVAMVRVGVIGQSELAAFHRIANGAASIDQQRLAARREVEAQRRSLSQARAANWAVNSDTPKMRLLETQAANKAAAEERQRLLDELYAEQIREAEASKAAQQELVQLRDDTRGRNLRSVLMLHDALAARAEQVAYKEQQQREAAAVDANVQRELQMLAWAAQTEELHKKMDARQRNMAEKNANLETVLIQLDQRRQVRASQLGERAQADAEAAEAAVEQAHEDADREAREYENSAFNVAHTRPRPSKAERLQTRLEENAKDTVKLQAEEQHQVAMRRWTRERQAQKQAAITQRQEASIPAYVAETDPAVNPTRRTQDVFTDRGESFLRRMEKGDQDRQEHERLYRQQLREQRVRAEEEAAAAAASGVEPPLLPRRAEIPSVAGYLSAAEERAYAEEMRGYPAQLRAKEATEAAERRAEAKRIEEIQRLQAAEKRENARREVEGRRREVLAQAEFQQADDARYAAFIESNLPPDMNPTLHRKAMQLQ